MIQKGTYLNVIDNSGVKLISCIHVGEGYRKRYAKVGDVIIASVKSIRFKQNLKVKKGSVVKALIVRNTLSSILKKKVALPLKFSENAAVILNSNNNKFLSTKIFGAVFKDFRYTRFSRVLTLSSGFLK